MRGRRVTAALNAAVEQDEPAVHAETCHAIALRSVHGCGAVRDCYTGGLVTQCTAMIYITVLTLGPLGPNFLS